MEDKGDAFLMGIDVGTMGCKTLISDVEGRITARAYRDYPVLSPRQGWAEEDAEVWWRSVTDTIRQALKTSRIDPRYIEGVTVSCTNACVPVTEEGHTLRKAIMQVDKRTTPQTLAMRKHVGEERIFTITGNRIAPGTFSAPIILWIKEREPEIFDNTYKFLTPTGFIVQRMTGRFTMDWSRCGTTLLFDIRSRNWSDKLCNELEIPMEKLPESMPSWELAGEVGDSAAKQTGLRKGTPVSAGCMDTVAAAVGNGAIRKCDSFCILGGVARICACLDGSTFDDRFINTPHSVPDTYLMVGCVNGCGISLKWFLNTLGHLEKEIAEENNRTPYQILDEEAEGSPPGAKGVIYLPYLAGERTPIWDPDAKGVLFGIDISSTREDIVRALLEGVAYAIRDNVEALESFRGETEKSLKISGGGSRSVLWRHIISDVLGKNLLTIQPSETEPFGDALIAGIGVGIYKDVDAAVKYVKTSQSVEPNMENHELYSVQYERYKRLYQNLRDEFSRSTILD